MSANRVCIFQDYGSYYSEFFDPEKVMENTIGMRIKECRLNKGMTQETLAETLFLPKSTVSAYENDRVDMKMGMIKELARALGTTAGYLIDGEKEELDVEIMQLARILQEMPEELRRVGVEQIKILMWLA